MKEGRWYSADDLCVVCPIHAVGKPLGEGKCPVSETFTYERCKRHGIYKQDSQSYIESGIDVKKYAKPICLECYWESGGEDELRVKFVPTIPEFFLTYGWINGRFPETNEGWLRNFNARLQRCLWKTRRMSRAKTGLMDNAQLALAIYPREHARDAREWSDKILEILRVSEVGTAKQRKGRGE